MLCAVVDLCYVQFSLFYVQFLGCVMCSFLVVLCAFVGLCYVLSLACVLHSFWFV